MKIEVGSRWAWLNDLMCRKIYGPYCAHTFVRVIKVENNQVKEECLLCGKLGAWSIETFLGSNINIDYK